MLICCNPPWDFGEGWAKQRMSFGFGFRVPLVCKMWHWELPLKQRSFQYSLGIELFEAGPPNNLRFEIRIQASHQGIHKKQQINLQGIIAELHQTFHNANGFSPEIHVVIIENRHVRSQIVFFHHGFLQDPSLIPEELWCCVNAIGLVKAFVGFSISCTLDKPSRNWYTITTSLLETHKQGMKMVVIHHCLCPAFEVRGPLF